MQTTFHIATPVDFDFIAEANADISNNSHQQELSPSEKERLYTDLFGKNPKAYVLIGMQSEMRVSMALYSSCYFANEGQIMWVSQFYILPSCRGKGIGQKMMDGVGRKGTWK